MFLLIIGPVSAALGCAAGRADKTAFLVYQRFLSTVGAFLSFGACAVGQIFLQRSLHAHLPCVDALGIKLQAPHKFKHLVDRHAIAQNAAYKLGIVPVFGIELVAEAFDCGLVATLVYELEVVAFVAVVVHGLDYLSVRNALGKEQTVFIVAETGEDFIRSSADESDESNPFFFVVLEAHHIGIKFYGAFYGNRRLWFIAFFLIDTSTPEREPSR